MTAQPEDFDAALDRAAKTIDGAESVVLIEDCAHALYARTGTVLPGSFGDYAIASTRKFIPGAEGGALVANGRGLEHPRRARARPTRRRNRRRPG